MDRTLYLNRLVEVFVGLVWTLLALRVVFRLFNANSSTPFVNWVYDTTEVVMAPFRGIFPPQVIERGYVLDVSAIFAAIVYAIIGYLLLALLDLLPGRNEPVVVEEAPKSRTRTKRVKR